MENYFSLVSPLYVPFFLFFFLCMCFIVSQEGDHLAIYVDVFPLAHRLLLFFFLCVCVSITLTLLHHYCAALYIRLAPPVPL